MSCGRQLTELEMSVQNAVKWLSNIDKLVWHNQGSSDRYKSFRHVQDEFIEFVAYVTELKKAFEQETKKCDDQRADQIKKDAMINEVRRDKVMKMAKHYDFEDQARRILAFTEQEEIIRKEKEEILKDFRVKMNNMPLYYDEELYDND